MVLLKVIIIAILIFFISKKMEGEQEKTVLKDFLIPSLDLNSSSDNDYKPVNSRYKKAWTETSVNKNPIHHTSNLENEKTDLGKFFDKNNQYIENKRSKNSLPENCFIENNELICKFNNKLENIPPTLIEEPEKNTLLKSIGDDKNINTNIIPSKNAVFGKENINVWDYKDEKTINGGKYFGNVTGYSEIDTALDLNNLKIKNYSL